MIVAAAVALPVRELAEGGRRAGRVLGGSPGTAHLDLGGFVVTVAAGARPLLPNEVTVPVPLRVPAGAPAELDGNRLPVGELMIELGSVRVWDPGPSERMPRGGELARRGEELVRGAGGGPLRLLPAEGREAWEALLEALGHGDRRGAAGAAGRLVGLGPGLTPVGDDLVAGAAWAAVRVMGVEWAGVLCPPDLDGRTTALAATLARLAARGRGPEPLGELFHPAAGPHRRREAGRRLVALGHSTGRAWALGSGAVARLVAAGR